MRDPSAFSQHERFWFVVVGVVGMIGLNGLFVYGLMYRRDAIQEALRNPIALAFILEAFVVMGLVAWVFGRWGRNRLGWGWIVVLCLIGGLAFGIPAVLLVTDPQPRPER